MHSLGDVTTAVLPIPHNSRAALVLCGAKNGIRTHHTPKHWQNKGLTKELHGFFFFIFNVWVSFFECLTLNSIKSSLSPETTQLYIFTNDNWMQCKRQSHMCAGNMSREHEGFQSASFILTTSQQKLLNFMTLTESFPDLSLVYFSK